MESNQFFWIHDFWDHSGHYEDFSSRLIKKNIFQKVTLWDLPGHGKRLAETSHYLDFSFYLKELSEQLEKLEGLWVVGGVGLGASLIIKALSHKKAGQNIKGVCFFNPMIKGQWRFSSAHNLASHALSGSWKKIKVPTPIELDQLSLDSKRRDKMRGDPLFSWQIPLNTKEEFDAFESGLMTASYFFHHPLLCFLSEHNSIYKSESSKLFVKAIPEQLLQLKLIETSEHDLLSMAYQEEILENIEVWKNGLENSSSS